MSEADDVERVAKAIWDKSSGRQLTLTECEHLARAAIAAMPSPADKWQDISTAPRDGTRILVRLAETGFPCSVWGRTRIAKWSNAAGEWRHMGGPLYPRTWMPLPEPLK